MMNDRPLENGPTFAAAVRRALAAALRRTLAQTTPATLALAILAGAAAAPAVAQAPSPVARDAAFTADWSPEDCGVFKLEANGDEPLCGHVSVPLRHGEPASPRIRLAVVIIPAADGTLRKPDPLFLAQGGPGGSTIGSFAQVLLDDPGKRPVLDRDLVLWDQRGTYFSQPRLQCRELQRLPAEPTPEQERDAVRRCGQRLAAEAGDLSAFNSLENARDVDAVRTALGYTEFNFYGVSYGTELGQFLMRERPQHLRAVVLDAVVPLGFNLVTDVPAVKQRVMEHYARSCAESAACNAAYPNLAARYVALLDRLDKAPVPLPAGPRDKAVRAMGGGPEPRRMTGRDLDEALFQSLYVREAVPLVPYIVDRAEQGDYSFALNFVQLMQSEVDDMADGMYLSVVCSGFGDTPAQALAFPGVLARFADAARNDARQILDACGDWAIRLLDKSLLQPVRSDIPTLLLSGSFDPVTPPAHADRVAAGLSRAWAYTFPSGSHGQAFTEPCANALIAAFLDDPASRPDGSCAAKARPAFYTPDQLLSLPGRDRGSSATMGDHLRALAGPAAVVGLALLLLFAAVPVYSVTEVVRIFRGRSWTPPEGWAGRLIGAAPWVPVLAGFLLLGFIAVVSGRVAAAVGRNQLLLLVGAVPSWVKQLTWLLVPFVLAMALMTVAMALLWRHRARSLAGRVFYTVLVVAGWAVCFALVRTGLFGW
jgi:pimeloyl-ACP methyl ester carboxylesterase